MRHGDPILPANDPSPSAPLPEDDSPPRSAADEDRIWFETVYQGNTTRQLSVRAIVSGMAIGAVMSISNLYVGLQTGWGLGVTITACIIAYAVFRSLEVVAFG